MRHTPSQAPPREPATTPRAGEDLASPPAWRPLHALGAFFVGVAVALLVGGIVITAAGVENPDDSPVVNIVGALILDGALVGSALLFAGLVERPKPWQFGFRRPRLWPAAGWAALGILSFYAFSAVYTVAVDPDAEQTITESLGADRGTLGLIAAGAMVILVAPVAEEFFFRGFFYRALRTRFPVLVAAIIDGALFGLIHGSSGPDALLLAPPLGVLGVAFCLVYERTGSLYAPIAMHAFNNSVAYAVQADGAAVSAVLGPVMLVGTLIAARRSRPVPQVAPALR